MCGRFTLTTEDLGALARELGAVLDTSFRRPWRPRFNVAPGDAHLLVRAQDRGGGLRLVEGRFGFETRPGERLVNARAESAATKPTFRRAWTEGRCAVPADGFFEWTGGRAARRPSWFHRGDGRPLLFAALQRPGGAGIPEFVILTVEANADVRSVHDRMPAILADGALAGWLAGGAPDLAAPGTLSARPVSTRVNSVAHDDPACLAPPEGDPQLPLL